MKIQYSKNWAKVRCPKCPGLNQVNKWNCPAFGVRWGKVLNQKDFHNFMALIPIPYSVKCDESSNYIEYFVRNTDILAKTRVKHS